MTELELFLGPKGSRQFALAFLRVAAIRLCVVGALLAAMNLGL